MSKIIIQVPMDDELLKKLNKESKKKKQARAEVIRQACQKFVKEAEEEELDRKYRDSYEKVPETSEWAEAQLKMLKEVWPKELW